VTTVDEVIRLVCEAHPDEPAEANAKKIGARLLAQVRTEFELWALVLPLVEEACRTYQEARVRAGERKTT
jgi:hypothetical protein